MSHIITFLSVIVLGFFLGMRHATDPDHVIAVSTIVSRERRVGIACLIGVLWGIGHTLTVVLVGGAIIVFRIGIPPRFGLTTELSVALMLIVLGILNLTGILGWITETFTSAKGSEGAIHTHLHGHGEYVHSHPHGHEPERHGHGGERTPLRWLDGKLGGIGLYQTLRPLIVGVVHGLAGSAAIALLVLTTITNPLWALAFLLVFGLGTIAGMMVITVAIALPFAYTASRFARINRSLGVASGLLSLGFGLFLVYQIGVVDGLFVGHPNWSPK